MLIASPNAVNQSPHISEQICVPGAFALERRETPTPTRSGLILAKVHQDKQL
jgi:hypothetical protein